ncbi:MAG: ATP-binding protein [Streptosporangiales bacterium]|nr:ATP-binding protein [Streptosporangiales bacterium]
MNATAETTPSPRDYGIEPRRLALPADTMSVADARYHVRRTLKRFPRLDDALICTSELVTNAIVHGSERRDALIVVVIHREDAFARITVEDSGGRSEPRLVWAQTRAEHFRGLMLVDALADCWGVYATSLGAHHVWFEMAATR